MKKLAIIEKLCELGSVENIGTFEYNGTKEELSHAFGFDAEVKVQINTRFENGLYMYDFDCELGSEPDVYLFVEDTSDPIGFYRIED